MLRALIAAVLFCGVGLAFGLSAAPQLHDWVHKRDRSASHECAATLLSSGSWEHSACEPTLTHAPGLRALQLVAFAVLPHLAPHLEFSLLEHAPPAFS